MIQASIFIKKICGLVVPLTLIINSCFDHGTFPNSLKTAKITPILKKKQAEREPCNYRPVNQLSTFSKIIEKPAIEQLDNHFPVKSP